MNTANNILRSIAAVALYVAAAGANAVEIYGIDSSGASTLISTTWITNGNPGAVVSDVSGGNGTDWEVLVGFNDFGDAESDTQTAAIYGGGTTVTGYSTYQVVFDVQAYSWDSYNNHIQAPGQIGLWDVFAVNMNEADFYWNIVQSDPIVAVDPAGVVVIEDGGTSASGGLSGSTWAWGGLDYSNGTFESDVGTYTLNLAGVNPGELLYVSAVLDTLTSPNSDTSYSSWGCFNATSSTDCPIPVVDVPEPSTLLLLSATGLLGLGFRRRRHT